MSGYSRHITTVLEDLSVELIWEIFDHMWYHEIYTAFQGLNSHVDSIIQGMKHRIDGAKMQKYTDHVLPISINVDNVVFIKLGWEIGEFLLKYPLEIFSKSLRSLKLDNFKKQYISETIDKLACLKRLTRLTIRFSRVYSYEPDVNELRHVFDVVFREATSLKHLNLFHTHSGEEALLIDLHTITTNLQTIAIYTLRLNDFIRLLSYVPNVKLMEMSVSINHGGITILPSEQIPTMGSLCQLSLFIWRGLELQPHIQSLLQKMPNMKQLTIQGYGDWSHVDGERWENILKTFCKRIKKFSLHITINVSKSSRCVTDIESKWRTAFWLEINTAVKRSYPYTFDLLFSVETNITVVQ
ncbi:unnamed protein product [Didymodactylos carnosus]|uniref:F-box domain-containing protein n=1 Tax=Didymodactylos carnosus TaxID=1234261 RepID=A0A813Z9P0_9BILA|nr:unnamed protein product [Didymodactylos carnosus]CAF3679562.1 unnamed protein product [Didymodactylos carnosus]